MKRWFVSRQGKLKGPFTLPQLQEMVNAQDLKPADLVCPEGGVPTTASRVPGLFPEPAPVKPVPSPAVVAAPAPAQPAATAVAARIPAPSHTHASPATHPSNPSGSGVLIGVALFGCLLLVGVLAAGAAGVWYLDRDKRIAQNSPQAPPADVGKKEKTNDGPIDLKNEPQKKSPKTTDDGTTLTGDSLKIADKIKPIGPVDAPPPPDPRNQKVQPAVDRGVAFLKTKVPELASLRAGYAGLNGLTLLECGVAPDDAAILRIAEIIRTAAPGMNQIYDLSASLFFLNRWDEGRPLGEKDRKMARSFALRIIGGQLSNGIWSYGGPVMAPEQEAKLLVTLQGGTYKPNGQIQSMPSTSNTQFAMLAVWGARKHGVPVRDPLLALAAYFHANQHPEGSWNYPNFSLKATATCAGLISLAIEVAILEGKEFAPIPRQPESAKKKADVDKAFAFVAKTIGRKKSDPWGGASLITGYSGGEFFDADGLGDLYFLWTLERVGVIYSKDLIGGKDWFDWGHPIVLRAQQPDGSWHEKQSYNFGPLIDTPFALLFLKRANIARDLTEMIRTRGGIKVK
jgi:GYF domain 2